MGAMDISAVLEQEAELLKSMGVEMDSDTVMMVNVGIIIVLASIILLRSLFGGGRSGAIADAALLIGLPDAGKTALFQQLQFGRVRQTVTSMMENQCSVVDKGTSVPLIDVPGHPRLRESIRGKYAKQAKRVVFVIDSKEFKDTSRETADLLLNVLDDSEFRQRTLLVACNKSDYDMMCSSEKFIKHRLEKEIDLLLSTRGKDVMATDGEAKESIMDGLLSAGDKFTFQAIAGSGGWEVRFGKCSAKKGEVDTVRDFVLHGVLPDPVA